MGGLPMAPGAPGWAGAGWPVPPPALPMMGCSGTAGEPDLIGPWIHIPMVQYSVLPSLANGALIEVALTDPNAPGMPCGTMVVSIHTLAHVDASGIFLECMYVGCSSPSMAPVLSALFAMHLWVGAASVLQCRGLRRGGTSGTAACAHDDHAHAQLVLSCGELDCTRLEGLRNRRGPGGRGRGEGHARSCLR